MFDWQSKFVIFGSLLVLFIATLIYFGVPVLMLAAAGGATKVMVNTKAQKYTWIPWVLALGGAAAWLGGLGR